MKKLYLTLRCLFALLVYFAAPHEAVSHPRGIIIASILGPNACGISTNNWCIQANGWTKVTPSPITTGSCTAGTADVNASCAAAADNSTAASFTAHTAGTTTLTIDSGTSPSIGQTVVRASGAVLGTILSGSSPSFVMSASSTIATEAMTSSPGNDTTCTLNDLTGQTTETLDTYAPAKPCYTAGVALGKFRSGSPDWMLLKGGQNWFGGINGNDGTFGKNGKSKAAPALATSYGGGYATLTRNSMVTNFGFRTQTTSGSNLIVLSFNMTDPLTDPASPLYRGVSLTGDTGVANCGAANILCNITTTLPAWIASECPTYNCYIIGTGVTNKFTAAPYTSNSLTLNGANFPYTATGVTYQIGSSMGSAGQMAMSLAGETNFALVEDVHFTRSNLQISQYTTVSTCIDLYVRRNTGSYGWFPVHGTNAYSDSQSRGCPSNLYEENVWNFGGHDPSQWLGGSSPQTHCFYLHDPSTPFDLKSNIVANCSATGAQDRDAGIVYNNLWINSPTSLFAVASSGNLNVSYNVVDGGAEFNYGERVASANLTSGTSIKFQGIETFVTSLGSGAILINLDNPGSVVGTITTASVTAADTVTLSGSGAGIFAGIRGDGVKVGDRLRMVMTQGIGYIVQRYSPYLLTGGAATTGGFPTYAPNSVVSISAGGATAVITEASAAFARPNDEMFSFNSGTAPPSPFVVGTNTAGCTGTVNTNPFTSVQTCEYYSVNASGNTYQAAATLGGTAIVATGSTANNVGRTGSRVFQFQTSVPTADTWNGLPSWILVGDPITTESAAAFSGGLTQLQAISTDRKTVTTSDPSTFSFQAGTVSVFQFGGVGNVNLPTINFTNNVAVRGINHGVQNLIAFQIQAFTWGVTGGGTYIHNWNTSTTTNFLDNSGVGITRGSTYTSSNTVGITLNDYDLTKYFGASVAAYDASLVNNTFTASITNGIMTVTAGTGPNVDDTVFDATGANGVIQYTRVASNPSAGQFVLTVSQNVTSRLMWSGSENHFVNTALLNAKKTGYDTRYTVFPANNYVRSGIQCGNQTTYPGSPACPQQNFLLKRDIDPASNDNSPMWLEKVG